MTVDNKYLEERVSELERLLEISRKEALYYQELAKDSGQRRLREINQLSRLIFERKRSEEDLRRSEEQLRAVFNAAENISFLIASASDRQGKNPIITEISPGTEKIFGYERNELLGKSVSILHSPGSVNFSNMTRNMRDGDVGFSGEVTLVRKSGDRFPALLSTHPLLNKEGEMIAAVGVSIDISNQKKLEAKLRQMEKVEAIGTLAGGIAHEFNNALSGIIGNIEILKMDAPEDGNIKRCTKNVMKSSLRMARLTDQLLAYAGGGKYREKIIFLNDFVENTLPILQHTIEPEIRLETDLTSDLLNVKVDVTQMQMVLSAAINNASEALDDRGRIRIATRRVDVDTAFAESHPELKAGPYVCVSIKDDGRGMDDETTSKIFEPFFTTKYQGRGLGMAAAYGVIRNHDGLIVVDSALGIGTDVRIYLPAVEVEIKEAKEAIPEVPIATGTILLIEDEEIILNVTRALLEKLGYRVLAARTGKEAIDIVESFDGDIDLALLDIKMPDMYGGKIYPIIKKARPNLKVIVCSGYAIDGPAQEILDKGAEDYLQKPYALATLSQKLKDVLRLE